MYTQHCRWSRGIWSLRWSTSRKTMTNSERTTCSWWLLLNCMLLTCVSLSSHTTRGLLTSAHATRAGILFERGHHFFQHIWRCDFYLRAAITNRERRLIKQIWYSQFPCSLTACFKISPWPHFNLYVGLADTNMQCTSSWSWYEAYFK